MAKKRVVKRAGPPGHYIKQWREHRELSQERLAERVDVSREAISQLENGHTGYSQGLLEALAYALACEPADLIVRDPSQQQMIWSLWDKLSQGQRKQAVRFIQAIAEDDKAA